MSATFRLHLQAATRYECIEDVVSFVASDASGSFGVMGGHERMMTVLEYGMARVRTLDRRRHYLALPGAVAYFAHNELYLSMRSYLLDDDYRTVAAALEHTLRREERRLRGLRDSVGRLESEMMRRLFRLGERGEHHRAR